jgi:protein-tyrosine-phosphatase
MVAWSAASASAVAQRCNDRLRELRHVPDQLLHPLRGLAVWRNIHRHGVPRSVLFVCQGNVCRSPFAAAAFARALPALLDGTVSTTSAGFIGPGRTPPESALSAALRRDIDLSAHRSELIRPDAARAADIVVVMSAEQAMAMRFRFAVLRATVVVLGDLDPWPITGRTIRDPWNGGAAMFDEVYARIDRCVRELARLVAEAHAR